jgi:hypothetical protein
MKIILKGEMTLADILQALFETLHNVEEDYAVRYTRGATLYINFTKSKEVLTDTTPRCFPMN